MFGIGSTELLVILLVGLIVLGPKSLASLSRTIGKVVGEFRRVSTDFQRTLNAEAAASEQKERLANLNAQGTPLATPTEATPQRSDQPQNPPRDEAVRPHTDPPSAQAWAPTPPPQSPVAQALAKTRAEAEAAEARTSPPPTSPKPQA